MGNVFRFSDGSVENGLSVSRRDSKTAVLSFLLTPKRSEKSLFLEKIFTRVLVVEEENVEGGRSYRITVQCMSTTSYSLQTFLLVAHKLETVPSVQDGRSFVLPLTTNASVIVLDSSPVCVPSDRYLINSNYR